MRKAWLTLLATFVVLLAAGGSYLVYKEKRGGGIPIERPDRQQIDKVVSVDKPKESYDVVVVGTDPEGVTAAISAARNGLKTLLVEPRESRNVLGGLMTEGWLNTIDMNYERINRSPIPGVHPVLNKGIFSEWYGMIEGQSFDVHTAANAFYKLVKNEKNIDVLMKAKKVDPLLEDGAKGTDGAETQLMTGVAITLPNGTQAKVSAKAVIDATQDADLAYAAGVPFTVNREDLGDKTSTMAVTLCFKVDNITQADWTKMRKYLDSQGAHDHSEVSVAGFGTEMKAYQASNKEKLRMRGLNIGRQNDDSVLINALLIFGVDPFDPKSVAAGKEAAEKELPLVIEFLRKNIAGFENAKLGGTAPELYVRETRHMVGMYRLSILDLLENKDFPDRVAFGSYAADIQPTGPSDFGSVTLDPVQYAVPFRSLVPQRVDGLLVVGRSASYDSLPHGSARVMPTGMAEAQSAGAAAKVAIDANASFRQMAGNQDLIGKMQSLVNEQGMELKPFSIKPDSAIYKEYNLSYLTHKQYPGLKAAVYSGIAVGSYANAYFKLDDASNPKRMENAMMSLRKRHSTQFKGNAAEANKAFDEETAKTIPLTLKQASYIMAKGVGLNVTADNAEAELIAKGIVKKATVDGFADKEKLTNGDTYMMLKDALERLANLRF